MQQSDYNRDEIITALRACGIRDGDVLFTHSNIGFFGRPESVHGPEEVYNLFKEAVFSIIGDGGTWIAPAFSYSFFRKQVFDPAHTPSTMGMLSEMMRKDPEAVRSLDPNFSVVAVGKDADYFVRNAPAHSFGKDSFWDRFLLRNGKICNFNFDAGSTYVHYVERSLAVPYRYDKAFVGTIVHNGEREERTVYHFVHSLEIPGDAADFSALDAISKKSGKAKIADLGRGKVLVIGARDTYKLIEDELKKNEKFLCVSGQKVTSNHL